jgi:hypothetical protein
MNNETRKHAVLIAAAIFAARDLTDWDGKRSPKLVATSQLFMTLLRRRSSSSRRWKPETRGLSQSGEAA